MDWIDIEFRVTGTDALILRPWFGRHHPINVVWNRADGPVTQRIPAGWGCIGSVGSLVFYGFVQGTREPWEVEIPSGTIWQVIPVDQ